ncbi:hypothetical protein V8F20_004921 [Naviculisporaceae sp. PSN 640]
MKFLSPLTDIIHPPFKAKQIYEFPLSNPLWIENQHLLPDGNLLISTFSPTSTVYALLLNPEDQTPSQAILQPILQLSPNTTAQLGITALGNSRYAIATGTLDLANGMFFPGTAKIQVIYLPTATHPVMTQLLQVIPIPQGKLLNGAISFPPEYGYNQPDVILVAESVLGQILRVNLATGAIDIISSDDLLCPGPGQDFPIGVNGIKIFKEHLYFTNSGRGIFGRFEIDSRGNQLGKAEILVDFGKATGFDDALDDLVIDPGSGDAYITRNDELFVYRAASKQVELVLGPETTNNSGVVLKGATSVGFGKNGKDLLVTTAGRTDGGSFVGGQVVRVHT